MIVRRSERRTPSLHHFAARLSGLALTLALAPDPASAWGDVAETPWTMFGFEGPRHCQLHGKSG